MAINQIKNESIHQTLFSASTCFSAVVYLSFQVSGQQSVRFFLEVLPTVRLWRGANQTSAHLQYAKQHFRYEYYSVLYKWYNRCVFCVACFCVLLAVVQAVSNPNGTINVQHHLLCAPAITRALQGEAQVVALICSRG